LGAYLVFVDESGFMLMGTVARTWAPRGNTPQIRYRYRHNKISVISGLSVSPRSQRIGLYYQFQDHNLRRSDVCRFLDDLLRHLRGPIIVVWDNGKIHKGDEIREFLENHPRLHLEYFPGYAPELNPDEGVWNQAKRALANNRPDTLDELLEQVLIELEKIRLSRAKLRFCFHDSELPPFLR
jgi:transposase